MGNHQPVKGRRVNDLDETARNREPGAFEIRDTLPDTQGIAFICPCGCGSEDYLPMGPEDRPRWDWDGNREEPTLTPSVLIHRQRTGEPRQEHWHGYLTKGVWTPC